MEIFIHVDTIYINVKYPSRDIYSRWARHVIGVDHRTLKLGINYAKVVIRTGGSGYKLSVWRGDIRAFLTPDTDDNRGIGKGMGIWVQLGPKFILANAGNIQKGVLEFLDLIGVVGEYEISITRLDLAVDVLGLDTRTLKHEEFLLGWVGRSQLRNTHTEECEVTGLEIGSRRSAVFLRIYDKVRQAAKIGELDYWFNIWGKPYGSVTRFEWQISPKKGNFQENLTNFYKLDNESIMQLMDYLMVWGRLAVPNENCQVKSRWLDAPLWEELRMAIKKWNPENLEPLKRIDTPSSKFTLEFANQFAGNLTGAMARANPEDPNFEDLYKKLYDSVPKYEILRDAKMKGKRILNLTQQEISVGDQE
ncbi:MAG: replication initiation factor domain-containing protein [Anaerolineaceae bacterium]|nr:replication initiation factor domain-containing protein [Anaerolineaceae bacterium]